MIRRIVTSEDLYNLCESFREFTKTNSINHYSDQKFCVDTIYSAWKNENLLINNTIIYANEENNIYDSVCWFVVNRDFRVNKTVASNYLWISKNNKNGYKCFRKCLNLINKKKINFTTVGFLDNSPYSNKIENFLLNIGAKLESKNYLLTDAF